MSSNNEKESTEVATTQTTTLQRSAGLSAISIQPRNIDELNQTALAIAQSGLYGVNSQAEAFTVMLTGIELGLTPTQSLRGIKNIKGTPTLSADLMLALVRSSPKCVEFEMVSLDKEHCTYTTTKTNGKTIERTFTMDDAHDAQLVKPGSNWEKYPKDMLRARAVSKLARQEYPDVLLGMYTPEEMQSVEAAQAAESSWSDSGVGRKPKPHEWLPDGSRMSFRRTDTDDWTAATRELGAAVGDDRESEGKLHALLAKRHDTSDWGHIPPFVLRWWAGFLESKGVDNVLDWLAAEVGLNLDDVEPRFFDEYDADEGVIDADFEEPADSAEPRPDLNRSPAARQDRDIDARSRSAEKKAWKKANGKIHGKLNGLEKYWVDAFHAFVKDAFEVGVDSDWNDLTVAHLQSTLKRLDEKEDVHAWVKDVSAEYLKAPAGVDWGGVSSLVHEVTGAKADRFQRTARALITSCGVEQYDELTEEQMQELWVDLESRSAVPPNGGQAGEISVREEWLAELIEERKRAAEDAA